jgi:hypothetical protein
MALKALTKIRRGRRGKPMPFSAPVGGLNRRDALAAMDPQYAYALDNWFPATDAIETRKGYTPHQGVLAATHVETLSAYNSPAGNKLLAFINGDIKDVSAANAPVDIGIAKFVNTSIVQSTHFVNAATNWFIMCNGKDTPQKYDGTTLSDAVITGVTGGSQNLVVPFSFKTRMYFAAEGQAGFYYLPVGAVQGAASYFDLGQVASRGGTLKAITSITKDSGDGPDDFIVFVMDTGEFIIYAGYDPSNANAWALVGRFYVSPPIGRKCTCKYGGDTLLITESGLVSLNSTFDGQPFNPDQDTVTFKLGSALTPFIANKATHGWQCLLYPSADMLVFNVPAGVTRGTYYQYVMNTRTNAWCRFVGFDGQAWELFNGELYFGDFQGKVWKALSGFSDNGSAIRCNAKQAYSYFDTPGVKKWNLCKLTLSSTGAPAISVGMGVDFKDDEPTYATAPLVGNDSLWNLATWNIDPWGAEEGVNYYTQDMNKLGFAGSVNVKCSVNNDQVRWYATEHVFEEGGLIGDTR